ncbi:MAG: TSUP family transporter [Verrucomicrobiota bacterium]
MVETLILCGFAFLAGLVDAVAGGGGLIQLPALLLVAPSAAAGSLATLLGTNKLSSICGTSVAAIQYARQVPIHWRMVVPAGIAAFFASLFGAVLATSTPSASLKPLVLVLLVIVLAYTLLQPDLGNVHAPKWDERRQLWVGMALSAVVGLYDGFLGPGTGSFLIFALVGIFGFGFLEASAAAKIINVATNLSAILWFASTGHILFTLALLMGVCNLMGGLLGARLAILKGNRFVRLLFLLVTSALIVKMTWDFLR